MAWSTRKSLLSTVSKEEGSMKNEYILYNQNGNNLHMKVALFLWNIIHSRFHITGKILLSLAGVQLLKGGPITNANANANATVSSWNRQRNNNMEYPEFQTLWFLFLINLHELSKTLLESSPCLLNKFIYVRFTVSNHTTYLHKWKKKIPELDTRF